MWDTLVMLHTPRATRPHANSLPTIVSFATIAGVFPGDAARVRDRVICNDRGSRFCARAWRARGSAERGGLRRVQRHAEALETGERFVEHGVRPLTIFGVPSVEQ